MGRTDRVEILDLGQLGSVHETSMWTQMLHFVTAGFQVDLARAGSYGVHSGVRVEWFSGEARMYLLISNSH